MRPSTASSYAHRGRGDASSASCLMSKSLRSARGESLRSPPPSSRTEVGWRHQNCPVNSFEERVAIRIRQLDVVPCRRGRKAEVEIAADRSSPLAMFVSRTGLPVRCSSSRSRNCSTDGGQRLRSRRRRRGSRGGDDHRHAVAEADGTLAGVLRRLASRFLLAGDVLNGDVDPFRNLPLSGSVGCGGTNGGMWSK